MTICTIQRRTCAIQYETGPKWNRTCAIQNRTCTIKTVYSQNFLVAPSDAYLRFFRYICIIMIPFMKPISTEKAPAAIGPYSQAIDSGAGLVFLSGQLPIDPSTGSFPEGGIKAQTKQSLLNAKAILEEAGLSLRNVVKTTVFLADMGDFAAMNEVYAEFFSMPFPARSAVAVKSLPKGALVEIESIAVRG